MAYPSAAGYPSNRSGVMIPEVWSGRVLKNLYDSCVLTAISNTDYEGEIKGQGG